MLSLFVKWNYIKIKKTIINILTINILILKKYKKYCLNFFVN